MYMFMMNSSPSSITSGAFIVRENSIPVFFNMLEEAIVKESSNVERTKII